MKKIFGVLAVSIFLIAACGGDGTETPTAFEDVEASPCVDVPVDVPSIGILGQRVPKVSDLKVCTNVKVSAGIVPEIQQFDDCGSPCYAVVINDFDIAAAAKVTISYKTDDQPVTTEYDPGPVNHEVGNGRLCVVSVGGPPDPCAERLTTPKTLSATAGKKQISLTWRASIDTGNDNLLGYEIWRSEDGTTFGQLATHAETSFVDTSVVKGTTYYYYVVAFDEEGNRSQASNTAQATAK
jgi:hypothetical protein